MADETNVKQPAPKIGDRTDTLAASVDNGANEDSPKKIEGFELGAPIIASVVAVHVLDEGIAERFGFITKVIDDVEGVALVTVLTNDPTNSCRVGQMRYSTEVGSHGTFRLATDTPNAPLDTTAPDTRTAAQVAEANTPSNSKRGSGNSGIGNGG